ncbi:hypothetical protein [Ramlibacter humi]|uniref:Uncharacterized protein n=1 Tax=Ramlibacter humi TaxID=2530451 RepID=A0A4Z0BBP5_9BURK|nr:hypothetical protein [Ramlibacter humi]TFY96585.1 hypothetical protein EZ216_20240 [Ramlibacter humi]
MLKRLLSPSRLPEKGADPKSVDFPAMELEDRKALRRALLFEAVKSAVEERGITRGRYRARLVALDKRGHSYLVLIELSKVYLTAALAKHMRLTYIGRAIINEAADCFGLLVREVYWRIAADTEEYPAVPDARLNAEEAKLFADYVALARDIRAAAREGQGSMADLPPLMLPSGTYSTDLTPL